MLVCMYCKIHVHNLFQNQPNLAAVNQGQSLKLKHRAQDPCSSNWACVLFKRKEPTLIYNPTQSNIKSF